MANEGQFIVHIEGKHGSIPISPDNFDITMLYEILGCVKDLLKQDKDIDVPTVLEGLEKGSVRGLFRTSKEQAVKVAAVLSMLAGSASLDQFDHGTSKAFEGFQSFAVRHNLSVGLATSESHHEVKIHPTSNLHRSRDMWVDAEVYLYGKITDAGGTTTTNIHLLTELGTLIIKASEEEIVSISENPLYKKYGIRALGKQHAETGEIDKKSLRFLEIIDYSPVFDEEYLESKIDAATPVWQGVDVDKFLLEIREDAYAG